MPFTKGKSGNPKGRPKDPIATNIREYIKDSIDLSKLNESLESLAVGSDYIRAHKAPPLCAASLKCH